MSSLVDSLVPCVVYAAKSTPDVRGSLGTQIADCVRSIGVLDGRRVVATFEDEAASGYSGNRGEGLEAAMSLSRRLASNAAGCELWVQHSDRLARGDGRTARHVVEIALWAIKAGVVVRCVEDTDTFRDLLHAVVVGERNHEDSKRKGASSAAGIRRAVARGDYCGNIVDGYRLAVDVDERGRVTKRMEFDPERRALFELIFRLARRGNGPGTIASKLNQRGWRTLPRREGGRVGPFIQSRITSVLANARYAGLSPLKGEILGAANWPGYITPKEFYARQARTPRRQRTATGRERLEFLLRRVAVCAHCGGRMSAVTGRPQIRGGRARIYLCHAHAVKACIALPVDADLVDHAFVAYLNRFIGDIAAGERPLTAGFPDGRLRGELPAGRAVAPVEMLIGELKLRIRGALERDDAETADLLIAELVEHRVRFEGFLSRPRHSHGPRLPTAAQSTADLLGDFYAWSANGLAGDPIDQDETLRLNGVVREWFEKIEIARTATGIDLTPRLAATLRGGSETTVHVDLPRWRITLRELGIARHRGEPWSEPEIIHALKEWTRQHGRAPMSIDWPAAIDWHPHAQTVFKRFGSWTAALDTADLQPAPRAPLPGPLTNDDIIEALQSWARRHGRPPRACDWTRSGPDHPNRTTVRKRFGTWSRGLAAAGLTTPKP